MNGSDSTRENIEALLKRIEDAERKAAIWRSQVVVLLLVFLVGGAAVHLWTRASFASRLEKVEAYTQKKVLEAEAFVVRDKTGKMLAVLGVHSDGGGRFEVWDNVGNLKEGLTQMRDWGRVIDPEGLPPEPPPTGGVTP